MTPNLKNTAVLLSLVLTIYIMRQAEVSPGGFLKHQVTRIVQEQKVSDKFCNNVDLSTTEAQAKNGESYRSGIRNIRDDDTLTDYINKNEPEDTFVKNYAKSMIPILVPWAVFFVIGLVGCFVYVINWCCMNCYCCKNCCRRACGTPKTDKRKTGYATFSLVLMLLTIGAGVAGLVFSGSIPRYASATVCSVVKFVEKIEDGSQEDNWVGIGPGVSQVNSLMAQITATSNGLGVFNQIFNKLTENIDDTSATLNTIYNEHRSATITRADPAQGTQYTPVYIQTFGPPSTPTTTTGMLQTELNVKKLLVQEISSTIDPVTNDIQADINEIVADIRDQIPTFQQVSDDINSGLDEIEDHKSTIDTIIDVIKGVLLGLFIANTAVAALAVLSIVLVCCGAKFFNKTIHVSWCAMGLLMLVGWLVSIGIFGLSIFLFETCDVGDGALKDPIFFNRTFDTLNYVFDLNDKDYENTRNILYRCVHGDGDISEEFDLRSNLVIFDEIFANVDRYNSLLADGIGRIPASFVLPLQENTFEQLRIGEIPDSQQTNEDLLALNTLTNSNANQCTLMADTWVLNSKLCSQTGGTSFENGSADTFNLFNPTCIGYDVWMANNNNINNRYSAVEFPPTCQNQNNDLQYIYLREFVNGFINNREETNTLVSAIQDDLNVVKGKTTEFTTDLQEIPQTTLALNSSVSNIYNTLTDENTGLIVTANCKFVVQSFEELLDVGCTGLGVSMYQTALVFLIMSFLTFFGTFMLFCLAKRFIVGKGEKNGQNRKDIAKKYRKKNSNEVLELAPKV